MAETNTTTTAAESTASSSSSAASAAGTAAKFAAQGVGIGILAAIGVDAYHGIKALVWRHREKKELKLDEEQIRKDERLKALEELHAGKGAKK